MRGLTQKSKNGANKFSETLKLAPLRLEKGWWAYGGGPTEVCTKSPEHRYYNIAITHISL